MMNKRKRILVLTVFLLGILFIAGAISAYGAASITLQLDGKTIPTDSPPVIESGRTLVPARAVFEAAGGTVTWDESKPSDVSVEYEGTTVALKVNSQTAYVNGKETPLEVPARLQNDRVLIPVRFVSEALNFQVKWDNDTRTVSLYTPGTEVPQKELGNITALGLAQNGNSYRVTITADKELGNYQNGKLTDPFRFYVDFADFNLAPTATDVTSSDGNSPVTGLRGGFNQDTDTTRIVMDLKGDFTPTISLSADKKEMYLDFKKTGFDPMADGKLVVMLDPGHGVDTPGKRSPDGSLREYEFNRDVANRIKPLLEAAGIQVLFTVSDDTDTPLKDRCDIANRSDADIYVSIHSNAFGSGWSAARGWEIYTYKKGGVAEELAKSIESASFPAIGLTDRGIKEADFYVLKNTDMPAVLIEHGFYTNIDEIQLLKSPDFRQKLAQADATGIINFFQKYR